MSRSLPSDFSIRSETRRQSSGASSGAALTPREREARSASLSSGLCASAQSPKRICSMGIVGNAEEGEEGAYAAGVAASAGVGASPLQPEPQGEASSRQTMPAASSAAVRHGRRGFDRFVVAREGEGEGVLRGRGPPAVRSGAHGNTRSFATDESITTTPLPRRSAAHKGHATGWLAGTCLKKAKRREKGVAVLGVPFLSAPPLHRSARGWEGAVEAVALDGLQAGLADQGTDAG